jgi:outer membrane protein assembly factor BamD (BamD/ComL family)
MIFREKLATAFILATLASRVDATEHDHKISVFRDQSIEIHTSQINVTLMQIAKQLQALRTTITAPGLGAQAIGLAETLTRAKAALDSKDWTNVLRESARYLSINQRPTPSVLLKIRYMQGVASEATGAISKAIVFYTQYLAVISTNIELNSPELTDVFGRLVNLVTNNPDLDSRESKYFLSTIAALDYPKNKVDQLEYLAALAGAKINQDDIARNWLDQIDTRSNSPDTRARARYLKALIAISNEKWQEAGDELKAISLIANLPDQIKYNALLALARIQAKTNKLKMATATYSQIPESSPFYKRAVFEQIYIMLRENNGAAASQLAEKWLKTYGTDHDAQKLRSLETLIALRNGDLDSAKILIERNRDLLSKIQKSIKTDFDKPRLTAEDIEQLSQLIQDIVPSTPELLDFAKMFDQIKQLQTRISVITESEVATISLLSGESLEITKPAIINQIEQYEVICDDLMQLAEALITSERKRLSKNLSEIDIYKLDFNSRERSIIFSNYERFRRQSERWRDWLISAQHANQLSSLWIRQSQMTGALSTIPGVDSDSNSKLTNLAERISGTRSDIQSTLRRVADRQAQNRAQTMGVFDILAIVRDFSRLTNQDRVILESYKPSANEAIANLDYEDSREAWTRWFNGVNLLNSNLLQLQENTKREFDDSISMLASIHQQKTKVLKDINSLVDQTELIGGKILPKLLSDIDYSINERLSRQLKWAGDLEYLRYRDTTDEQSRANRKRAVELQILSDSKEDFGLRSIR